MIVVTGADSRLHHRFSLHESGHTGSGF